MKEETDGSNGGKEVVETPPKQEPESGVSTKESKGSKRWARIKLPLLVLPYVIGVVWHCLHPLVSVFTGHMVPRRWYIDESSLEPSYFRMDHQYDLLQQKQHRSRLNSLCEALATEDSDAISCHRHQDQFEIARILPTVGTIAPVTEAIVLFVPSSKDWANDQFHASVLQLVRRLSVAPWLAKTVLLVTPSPGVTIEHLLTDTVDSFLDSYLGPLETFSGSGNYSQAPLPSSFTGAILRNLLVLDIAAQPDGPREIEIRILPQGRRGVLPNMDLTFLTMFVYSKSNMIARKRIPSMLVMHPYSTKTNEMWTQWIQPHLDSRLHDWARKLTELLAFEYSLAMPPYPPHASALDRGIDALTIQAVLQGRSEQARARDVAEFVQKMELLVRSLSNLHERLHHSTALYLLTSPERFVKHEEYLVPNLLLLIPLIVRALSLVLIDIQRFHWGAFKWALQWTLAGTALCVAVGLPLVDGWVARDWVATDRMTASHGVVALVYLALLVFFGLRGRRGRKNIWMEKQHSQETIQFLACMWALVVHVPISFGHVSLAFPSSLFWTPLIAFPSTAPKKGPTPTKDMVLGWILLATSLALVVATFPGTFLVPHVFAEYTTYVQYGYIPLHLLWMSLELSKLL